MENTLGTWDYDLTTGLLSLEPAGCMIGGLRISEQRLPLAELTSHLHHDDRESLSQTIGEVLERTMPAFRHRFRIGSGKDWTWIEATGRLSTNGCILSGIWADITAAKESEVRKDEAVARVHQFAAAAAHDLIAPLRHIAIYGEILIDDLGSEASPDRRRMLEVITDKARNLQVLTRTLISFSTDVATPANVAVPLAAAFSQAQGVLRAEFDEVDAILDLPEHLPDVAGDPLLIGKVIENLIRNALQWRPATQPVITVATSRRDGSVRIRISDNGIGIDPRYHDRIFDAFWALPRPDGERGVGLGLAVCKTITHALGGDLTLASSTPEGSAFELVLPAVP
jgi:signal transduction histidine kinase